MEAHTDTVNGLRADIDRYGLVSFIQGLWDGITGLSVPPLRLLFRCRDGNFLYKQPVHKLLRHPFRFFGKKHKLRNNLLCFIPNS